MDRNERFELRANASEMKQIDQVARKLDMSKSEAIRHLVNLEVKRNK